LSLIASEVATLGTTKNPWYKLLPLTITALPLVLIDVMLEPIGGRELASVIVPGTVNVIVLPAPFAFASRIA
jgi:hypothetical protein